MSKLRPSLADVKRKSPQDLATCDGYVWHLGTCIGKGSFGEVYLGWNTPGNMEVAVKVVGKDFFKQDPKVKENLEREIRVLKLLRGCEYVVRLLHVQEMKRHIVLVMELCEYDLDHLVKVAPFKEDDISLFLFQLCKGMKALRDRNIVHRDLKPGNILIKKHPHTGKMMIKLADFGFARHFKDEGAKPIDMTSLAGTPVFMAPEALRCVFHPGEHYDDKVDIWSIGALLYKVIVGKCGFYAQLQDIPRILRHKGDAIAFERIPNSRKINYINELPSTVGANMSEAFTEKMNSLLSSLLKLDPTERMNFPDLFEFVDDLITSKIEVVNLLHGTSVKIILDRGMSPQQLTGEIHGLTKIPPDSQIIFCSSSPHYLTPHSSLTPAEFTQLLDSAGALKGYAHLLLIPMKDLDESSVLANIDCLSQLEFAVSDVMECVNMVVDYKFTNQMISMIGELQSQQKNQIEGMEQFCKFCSQELEKLTSQRNYTELYQRGLQAHGKAVLAMDWLIADIDQLVASHLPDSVYQQLRIDLQSINQLRAETDQVVTQFGVHYQSCQSSLTRGRAASDLQTDDISKTLAALSDEAKKMKDNYRRDQIHPMCQRIYTDCKSIAQEVTDKVFAVLKGAYASLAAAWAMSREVGELERLCAALDSHLQQMIPRSRSAVLRSITAGGSVTETPHQGAVAPNVMVTPPGSNWNAPPPTLFSIPTATQNTGPDPLQMSAMKEDRDRYKQLYEGKSKEYSELLVKMDSMKGQQRERRVSTGSAGGEVESTIVAGTLHPPSAGAQESTSLLSSADSRTLEALTDELRKFCFNAEIITGQTLPKAQASPPTAARQNSGLYPNVEDYSIINMPGSNSPQTNRASGVSPSIASQQSISELLPQAQFMISLVKGGVESLQNSMTYAHLNLAIIKVARAVDYRTGDIVLFNPIRLPHPRSNLPRFMLMHLDRPKPYILLDHGSYGLFGIRPNRVPDLIIARLTENPRELKFRDHPYVADDFDQKDGVFFQVKAEPTKAKFPITRPPPRPVSSPTTATPTTPDSPKPHSPKSTHGFLGRIKKHSSSSSKGYV